MKKQISVRKINVKRMILSMVLGMCIICSSVPAAFSAADPANNAVDLAEWKNGETLPISSSQTPLPSQLLRIVKSNTVDSAATADDRAIHMAYYDSDGKPAAGRGVGYWTLTDDASVGKHLSFGLYIPGYDFYGNLRGAYTKSGGARYLRNGADAYVNEIEFNVQGSQKQAAIKIKNGDLATEIVSEVLSTDRWYDFDIFFCDKEIYYYIDGEYTGKGDITPDAGLKTSEGHSYGFQGFQLLPGKKESTTTYDEKAGIYFNDIKLNTYDYNAETFSAVAKQDEKVLNVVFSEKPKVGQSVEQIKVYNTETGGELNIETSVLNGDTMTVCTTDDIKQGVEYMIDMPDSFESIRGKKLYSDIYFIGSATPYTVDFNSIAADTETVTDGNVTAVKSNADLGSNGYRFGNTAVADKIWISNGLVGIKDLSASDGKHGNVLVVRNIPSNPRLNKDIPFGVLKIDKSVDLTAGPATLEFDIKIPDLSKLKYMYFEPYAENSTYNSVQNEVNPNGIDTTTYTHYKANTQYAQVYAPSAQGKKFNMRNDGKIVGGGAYDSKSEFSHSSEYSENTWAKVKFVIEKSGENYIAALYVNGNLVGSVTNVNGDEKTAKLRGIRFVVQTDKSVTAFEDLVYFDNFKFSGTTSSEKVSKVRIYNRDNEEFGMLSNGVKGSAANADIFFSGKVNSENAVVLLTGQDGSTITATNGVYESSANKLPVKFNSLLKPSTKYTISVTGLINSAGTEIADYSASFTTSSEKEFEIVMDVVDGNGTPITDVANLKLNDKVYVKANVLNTTSESKTVAFSAATYNDNAMSDVDTKEFTIGACESMYIDNTSGDNSVFGEVKDVEALKIQIFAWDSFTTIKPLVASVSR